MGKMKDLAIMERDEHPCIQKRAVAYVAAQVAQHPESEPYAMELEWAWLAGYEAVHTDGAAVSADTVYQLAMQAAKDTRATSLRQMQVGEFNKFTRAFARLVQIETRRVDAQQARGDR